MTEPRSAASSPPRPLLVRFGAMGDLVLVQPMIRLLSERFGAPVDILSAGGWVRPLYEGQPGVGEIFRETRAAGRTACTGATPGVVLRLR